MITERAILGKIEILEDGQIQLREDTIIERDGVEIARTGHRRVLEPTEVAPADSKRLADVATAVWTSEVIQTYRDKKRQAQVEFDTLGQAKSVPKG